MVNVVLARDWNNCMMTRCGRAKNDYKNGETGIMMNDEKRNEHGRMSFAETGIIIGVEAIKSKSVHGAAPIDT